MGRVDEYSKRFIALSYRDTMLSESQQIQLFITGLGGPLRTGVALQQPSSLDDTVIFAHAYDATPIIVMLFGPDHDATGTYCFGGNPSSLLGVRQQISGQFHPPLAIGDHPTAQRREVLQVRQALHAMPPAALQATVRHRSRGRRRR
jgi:hypothetical protein